MSTRARESPSSAHSTTPPNLSLSLSPDALDALADALADRLHERSGAQSRTPSEWLTTAEAVGYLRLPSLDSLHRLTASGAVPHCKVGGRCLFSRTQLDAWLHDHYAGPVQYSPRTD